MTERQVIAEIERARKAFLLNNWQITVVCENAETLDDEGTTANIHWDSPYWQATIRVATKREDRLVKESIMHEVLHLALVELVDAGYSLADRLGSEAAEIARKQINEANEHTVRRFEFALRESNYAKEWAS